MQKYTWPDPPGQVAFPVTRAGYPLIFGFAFITIVFALLDFTILCLLGLVFTIFICCFFRDPERLIPKKQGAVVSPADGKIIAAGIVDSNAFVEGACLKISIFMSVFNVHINRIPYDGTIRSVNYSPGKFFSANRDKASNHNEHNAVLLETEDGQNVCFIQIAGLIARRIICNVQEGDEVVRGQRFGMICFGSRLDVYLPNHTKLDVTVGNTVKAGTSILGYLT